MNRNLWELYKSSERGKNTITIFNPNGEDMYAKAEQIFSFVEQTTGINPQYAGDMLFVIDSNCEIENISFEEDIANRAWFEQFIDKFLYGHFRIHQSDRLTCHQ